jgi:hypothetical protein
VGKIAEPRRVPAASAEARTGEDPVAHRDRARGNVPGLGNAGELAGRRNHECCRDGGRPGQDLEAVGSEALVADLPPRVDGLEASESGRAGREDAVLEPGRDVERRAGVDPLALTARLDVEDSVHDERPVGPHTGLFEARPGGARPGQLGEDVGRVSQQSEAEHEPTGSNRSEVGRRDVHRFPVTVAPDPRGSDGLGDPE